MSGSLPIVFDKTVCDEVRNLFLSLATPANYYDADVERIKSDDTYVSRFLTHQRESEDRVVANYTPKDKDEAAKMIDSVLTWRKNSGVRDLDYSKDVDPLMKSIYFRNTDSDGNAILWLEVKHYVKTRREEFQNYLLWLVEHRAKEAECSQITCVLALDGVGMSQADVEFIKYFINIFMYYTADVLKKMVIHNMHWLLNGVWKIVSVILSEGAKKRIVFHKNQEIYKTLPKESVTAIAGGPDPYKPDIPKK